MKIRYGWLLLFIVLLFTTNASAFSDDFSDNEMTDWTIESGAATASSGYIHPQGTSIIRHTKTAGEHYYKFDTMADSTSNSGYIDVYWEGNLTTGGCGAKIDGIVGSDFTMADTGACASFSHTVDYTGSSWITWEFIISDNHDQITINVYRNSTELEYTTTTGYTPSVFSGANLYLTTYATSGNFVNLDNVVTGMSDPTLPTSGSIIFDADYYSIDDTFDVTASLTNPDFDYYLYYYDLIDPNGIVRETGQIYEGAIFPGHDTSDTLADIPGTWQIELYGCGLGICWANRVDLDDDTTEVSGGTGAYASYIFLNKVNYDLSEVANITYSIDNENWTASPWGTNFRIEIVDNEGKGFFDLQLAEQNGSIDYVFPETGVYKVNLVKRSWGVFGSIIAYDGATVTEDLVDANGYGLKVSPTTINCGGAMYFTVYSENPSLYDTYLNVTNATTTISSVEITSNPASFSLTFGTYSGSFYAKLMNGTTVEKQQLIKINTCYGSGNNGDGIQPGSGFGDGSTYTSDTASSNAQQNFINFIAYPIFWGLLILIVIVMVLALNHYGDAIPYVVPVVVFFELVIGLLEPYTAFIGVGMVVFIVGMILIKQRS